MRTLIIASEKGSLINFRGDLIKELILRGSSVYAAAPELVHKTAEAQTLQSLGAIPVEIRHLDRSSTGIFADLRAFLALLRLMIRIRPGLVIGYTVKPVIYGLLASRLLAVPKRVALITGLGYSFIESHGQDRKRRLVSWVVHTLYRISLAGATKVFFQNPDDRDTFLARRIIGPSTPTCVVNGSGVNLSRFSPSPLPSGPIVFLMVARILRDKGVAEYIAAGRSVKRAFPAADIVLAGPSDSNPGAIGQEELDQLLQGSGVRYIGLISDVHSLMASCHVFVLPSYREGTPRTVLEAMAVGRPIVTTDVPGCRETVKDAFNGFLVKEKSAEALRDAMLKFLENPSIVEVMGANSLTVVRQKYDVRKVNASILDAIGI